MAIGYTKLSKSVSWLADDLTVKSIKTCDMILTMRLLQQLCAWSNCKCFKFKESKSTILALDESGKVVDPKVLLNGKLIPSLNNKPFKCLGRRIYPTLDDKD